MPLCAAIIYTADADWSAPEHAAEMGEYGAFPASVTEIMRGSTETRRCSCSTSRA